MTPSQKQQYWRKYAGQNADMERIALAIMLRALDDCLKAVSASVRQIGAEQTLAQLDSVFPNDRIRKAYEDLYMRIGVKQKVWSDADIKERFPQKKEDERDRIRRILKPVVPPPTLIDTGFNLGFFNPLWLARLKNIVNGLDVAQRVSSVSETVKKQIKKSLSESVTQFVSPRKIIAKLREDVGGLFSRQRAEVIVRTEVTQISNIAAEQSALETGLTLVKTWIHTLDTRTRDAHRSVSTKPIKSFEKFLVGGKRMDKPGDPAGGLANIINCRCVVAFLPADDYEDLGF